MGLDSLGVLGELGSYTHQAEQDGDPVGGNVVLIIPKALILQNMINTCTNSGQTTAVGEGRTSC